MNFDYVRPIVRSATMPETNSLTHCMRLTNRQRKIIYIAMTIAFGLVVFPPHLRPVGQGVYASAGFAPIWSPPTWTNDVASIINVALLGLLLIVVVAFTMTICYLQSSEEIEAQAPQNKSDASITGVQVRSQPEKPTATTRPSEPMGSCPNCDFTIALASKSCPKCKAMFGAGSTWTVSPIAPR